MFTMSDISQRQTNRYVESQHILNVVVRIPMERCIYAITLDENTLNMNIYKRYTVNKVRKYTKAKNKRLQDLMTCIEVSRQEMSQEELKDLGISKAFSICIANDVQTVIQIAYHLDGSKSIYVVNEEDELCRVQPTTKLSMSKKSLIFYECDIDSEILVPCP